MAQTKNISITPGGTPQIIHVSQNDVGRSIVLNITDGSGWYDLTGSTVKLQGIKPSGLGYSVEGVVNGHTATIVTTKQMTGEAGSIESELKITKNNTVIGTANITLAVERDPHPENTTDGTIDEIIPEITVLVERIEAAVERAEILHEAEAWAVGERDGVPVSPDDDTYHNNSKYYSEQSAESATESAGYAEDAEDSAEDAEASKIAAAASDSDASYQRAQALIAKAAAEEAAGLAEGYAQQAANVFQIAGNSSLSINPTTRKVTLHVTVSE